MEYYFNDRNKRDERGFAKGVNLDSETATRQDIQSVIRSLSHIRSERRNQAPRLVRFIELCKNLNNEEKVELEKEISTMHDYWGFYTSLRTSLYNLILLKQKNKEGFFKEEELASSKTMIGDAIIFTSYEKETLRTKYGDREYEFQVYKLTEFGKSILDKLIDRGVEIATEERNRLEKIGF